MTAKQFTPIMERDVEVEVKDLAVSVTLYCNGPYEAQVLADDLRDRIKSGKAIILVMQQTENQEG